MLNSTGTNSTHMPAVDPLAIVQELGMGLVMMPLVSILQHLAIVKHYAGTYNTGISPSYMKIQ